MVIRLSHSSLGTFNICERLFQLKKLLDTSTYVGDVGNPTFILGHAFETGVISYLKYQDKERAQFEAWLRWYHLSPEGEYSFPTDQKRSPYILTKILKKAFPLLDDILLDHRIASFQGKPAIQLSFRINISENFYYVGFIDFILHNMITKKYSVWDCKSTALTLQDLTPIYIHSNQLISYSTVLDAIVGEELASYDISYFTAQLQDDPKLKIYEFAKTLKDRLDFFISLKLDVQRIENLQSLGIFPKREKGCLSYNRPCSYLQFCSLHSLDNLQKSEKIDDTEYQFTFSLDDLIANHLKRI